jgi:hypothetical protein
MVVRVTVVDGDAASMLVERLRSELGVEEAGFEAEHHLVRIAIARTPDGTLVDVLNLVESWLGSAGLPPTNVEIDDRRYMLGAGR